MEVSSSSILMATSISHNSSDLKTYWRFTTNMLDIALHHHYQHINCVYVFGSKHL